MFSSNSGQFFLLIVCTFLVVMPARAQDDVPETLNVFLDCGRSCDFDYVRRTIPYVNYVRDRVGSDVHVLITNQGTGSGGRNYELKFLGQGALSSMVEEMMYATSSTDTDAERRAGLTEAIARGLVRFLLTTEVGQRIQITVPVVEQSSLPETEEIIDDPWNFWVFNVRMTGSMEGQEAERQTQVETRVSADRVTEEWKFGLSGRFDYEENEFDLSSGTVRSINRNGNVYGQLIKSLGAHWSAGMTTYSNTSSSNNTDLSMSISPTVEFAFFPYSQTSTRDFRARYEVNIRRNQYEELTVYNKMDQVLVQNQLMIFSNFRQPWGSSRASISLESYVTDFEESLFDLYNIRFRTEFDIRVARGLSLTTDVELSSVHDQIWLPAQQSNDEDVLLGNKNLPTSFEYEVSLGFSYRFGSIYNNVVNPRFGYNY